MRSSKVKVYRPVETDIAQIELYDKIKIRFIDRFYTITAIRQDGDGMLFCFDSCIAGSYRMKGDSTNFENEDQNNYRRSAIRKWLQNNEHLLKWNPIYDYMIPFENGDMLRLATYDELFGCDENEYRHGFIENIGGSQIPYFEDRENRKATKSGLPVWYWLQNKQLQTYRYSICTIDGFSDGMNGINTDGSMRPLLKLRIQ